MAGAGYGVEVIGAREAQAALTQAMIEFEPEVHAVYTEAAELLETEIQAEMADQMVSDERTGRLESSVKGIATKDSAGVKVGGTSIPYGPWWEFGGSTKSPRGGGNREIVRGGRTVYPTAARLRPQILAAFDAVAEKIFRTIAGR